MDNKLLEFTMDVINDIVSFKVYDKFDITISMKDWKFMCQKRWFTNRPYKDEVEAEFGLYGARNAKTSEEAFQCVKECIEDLKSVIGADIKDQCNKLIDSDISTFLTIDKDGTLVVVEGNNEHS